MPSTRRRPSLAPAKRTPKAKRTSKKAIRYAVIGLGHIAQAAVLPAFKHASRNSVLAALVSDDSKKLEALGRKYKAAHLCHYDALDQLLASGEIDAVYIALPNTLHEEFTVRAAKAGIHVLCEKPIAVTTAECERMLKSVKENKVRLMIAYRLHFDRANLEAQKLARSGKLGDLRFFTSEFAMQAKPDNIRLKKDLGGGPLYDIGIYCINAARNTFAADPIEVWAAATNSGDKRFREVPESVTACLKFPGDRIATFTCSFGAFTRSTYSITGTKGSLTLDPAYTYKGTLAYEARIGEKKIRQRFGKSDQFAAELLYFSDCVLKGREPEPSGDEGLIDVRIIEGLNRSIDTGRWVKLKAQQRKRRPSMKQEIRRPPVPREPTLVKVEPPHS